MLNDADGYQGGGNVSDSARDTVKDADALFSKLKKWIKTDYNSKGQVKWRKEAREGFEYFHRFCEPLPKLLRERPIGREAKEALIWSV